ncbi:glycosyltransferase family 2 protein [Synechococcus sp. AH-224-I15]|nr:glycosyltransferase family 2 protein [Synechococcus sp. AH-224-I15]
MSKELATLREMKDNPPLLSIVICTFNTPPSILSSTLDSILKSSYANIEVCITDDGSTNQRTIECLRKYKSKNKRLKLDLKARNSGISEATNNSLKMCKGKFIAFIDHDDEITHDAIEKCVFCLLKNNLDAVYTDQATVNANRDIIHVFRKPAWSQEYLRHVMYVGHLLVLKKALTDKVGLFNSKFDGVQDFDYMLRVSEFTNKIGHIAEVLYYWKAIDGSLAKNPDAKDNISNLQSLSVQGHLNRLKIKGEAAPHTLFAHRCQIKPKLTVKPFVSIIIPTKNALSFIKTSLDSIYDITTYPNYEVICVDTGTDDAETIDYLEKSRSTVIRFVKPKFNFSAACNFGARNANGDILIFLNNDIEILDHDWIDRLVLPLQQSKNGISGPLLVYPNNTVQHAGVVIGPRGTADHAMRYFPCTSDGYAGSLSSSREVSAVTGACLAIKRNIFNECRGFDELYHTHYQDVDLCLKAISLSLNVIYVASTKIIHHESITRGGYYDMLDRMLFIDTWSDYICNGDPYYNHALNLKEIDYSLATSEAATTIFTSRNSFSHKAKAKLKRLIPKRMLYSSRLSNIKLRIKSLLSA